MFAKWLKSFRNLSADKRMLAMLSDSVFRGFPLLLVGSTLTVRLWESHYSLCLNRFVFVGPHTPYRFQNGHGRPLIDRAFVCRCLTVWDGGAAGHCLFSLACWRAILAMAAINPHFHTAWMALAAFIVAGCSRFAGYYSRRLPY